MSLSTTVKNIMLKRLITKEKSLSFYIEYLSLKEKHEKKNKALEKQAKVREAIARKVAEPEEILHFQMKENAILDVQNLTMKFGGLIAVDNLSFSVKKGEIFGLIGPNGAGKTTVFNCITQFYKTPFGNTLYVNNQNKIVNLNEYAVHNVIKQGIVRTFQNIELIWELTILENLLIAGHTLYTSGFFSHLLKMPKYRKEDYVIRAKALRILKDLGLDMYANVYPIGLPYGVLKLVELARTLMTNPNLIILDEPAAGLNEQETEKLAKTIKKIQSDYDATIFLVEHDMGFVMQLCDTICAISFGKKLAMGTPEAIKSNKKVQEAYLGGE